MTADQEHPTTPTPQQVANFVLAAATETETHGWVGGPEAATAITTLVRSLVDVALKLPHHTQDEGGWGDCPLYVEDIPAWLKAADAARAEADGRPPKICDCDWAERALAILRPIANLYGVDPKDKP